MDQEAAQLRVFERLRKAAAWLRVPPDVFEDVVQEAWLLALDYAVKSGKSLDDLSNTEFRFRCLEAKRKIIAPHQERFLGEDVIELAAQKLPTTEEIVGAEIKTSDSSEGRLSRLTWLLEVHPVLKLTDHQRALWDLMRREGKHGWQVDYARGHLITPQAVNKTVAAIRKKVIRAADLVRLAEGDIDYFFNRYGREWNSRSLRVTLIDLFRPQLGAGVNPELTQLFLPLQKSFTERAAGILQEEIRHITAGNQPRPENLAFGINIFYSADNMVYSPLLKSVAEDICRTGKKIGPFFDIAFTRYRYLYSADCWIERYLGWLDEGLRINDPIGRNYANYHLVYYHAVPESDRVKFLRSVGNNTFSKFSYPIIISRAYDNVRNSLYAQNRRLLDLNFLRFLMIKKYFPLELNSLPLYSRHTLKILAQGAIHSKEPLVVRGAEEILTSVGV